MVDKGEGIVKLDDDMVHICLTSEEFGRLLTYTTPVVPLVKSAVIEGDCSEILQNLPSGLVDLLLTDSPYGVRYQSNRRVVRPKFPRMPADADLTWLPEFVDAVYRVMREPSHLYCFCKWNTYSTFYAEFARMFTMKGCIVWVKTNHGTGDLKGAWAPQHEFVLHCTKGRRELMGHRPSNVQVFAAPSSAARQHAVEKPVELLKLIIERSSLPGEVVLDPFCGSGTTGIAALQTGRRFFGIDILPEMVKLTQERLKEVAEKEENTGCP